MSKPNNKSYESKKDSKSNKKGGYKPKQQKPKAELPVETPQDEKAGNINDSSYYYTDTQLRDQIMNFSFNEYLGRPVPYETDLNLPLPKCFPSNLMAFEINPSIAPTGDPTQGRSNGVNLAGLKNYLSLSADNAKTTNYGPEDVTALILALSELIKMVDHATRCFGILNYFDKRNWGAPRIFFNAMGIDFDDFKANAADYRIKLNTLIASIDKMPIPANIKLLEKAGNWFKTIYKDGAGPMPQTYMFVPYSTWVLDEAGSTGGSVLTTRYVAENAYYAGDTWDHTFNRILSIISDQVGALLTSSTMQYIFSDLLRKAGMGKQPLGNIAGVPDGYNIEFYNSDEIKLWVHNMTIIGPPVDQDWKHSIYERGNTGLNDVWCSAQDAGVIYNPEFYSCASGDKYWDQFEPDAQPQHMSQLGTYLLESLIVDYFVEPDVEAKVASTRLAARGKVHNGSTTNNGLYYANEMALGDAYTVHAKIYTNDHDAPLSFTTLTEYFNDNALSALTDFNLYPMTYGVRGNKAQLQEVSSITNIIQHGELNYFTMLDYNFIKRMFEAEMIGLMEMRTGNN